MALKIFQNPTEAAFIISLIVCEIIVNASNDFYLPALPQVQQYFKIDYNYTQATIIIWFIGGWCSQLLAAYSADKWGKRVAMWCGMFIFTIFTFICAIAPSYVVFCVARFMQGASVSIIVVAGYSTIHEIFDDIKAAQISSVMGGCLMIAPSMGPLIGAFCLEKVSWNHIFLVILLPLGLCIISLYIFMPKIAKIQISTEETFNKFITLLKNKVFLLKTFIAALMYSITLIWIINSPYIFMEIFHLTPMDYGIVQIPVFLSYLLGGCLIPHIRKIIPKISLQGFVFLGLISASFINIFFVSTLYFISPTPPLYYFLLYISLLEFSLGLAFGPMTRIIINTGDQSTAVTIASYDLVMVFIGTIILTVCSYFLITDLIQIGCLILTMSLTSMLLLCYLSSKQLS